MIPIKEFINAQTNCVLVRTSFKVDLTALREFFENEVKPLKKQYQGKKTTHGGWSVQSNDGTIEDGWQVGGALHKVVDGKLVVDPEAKAKMFPLGQRFQTPTPLHKGAAETLVSELRTVNFDPKRTRFSELEVDGSCGWHVDGGVRETWRGHIALYTNPGAEFHWRSRDKSEVMSYCIPADGYLYLARLDQYHRVTNTGSEDRLHILTDSALPIDLANIEVEPLVSLKIC
jgi:hypothetical protein